MTPDDAEHSQEPTSRAPRRRRRRGPGPRPVPPPSVPAAEDIAGTPADDPREPLAQPGEEVLAEEYADTSAFYRFSAFLGLAAVALLVGALVLYNVEGALTRSVAVLLIIALTLGVLYVLPRGGEVLGWTRTRTAQQGGSVTLASVAFLGLLVVGNWYVNRHSPQWDLTASQRFTLSDQSVKILSQLDRDVKVTGFYPSRQEDSFVRGTKDLLRQYARRSARVTVEFIDPDVSPGLARQFNIQSYPITIFQAGDRREETTGVTEQDFTSALLKLTRTESKKVYFVQGHQERDPDSAQQAGFNAAVEALKRENYTVDKLSLLATQRVPEDAAVLVVAGPRAPFLDPERQALEDYLSGGGKLLLLLDPRQDAGLGDLLDRWSVVVGNDLVVDPGRNYVGDPLALLPQPQSGHRITTSLPDLILPGTRSVSIKPGAGSEVAIVPLLRTTDRSWRETNFSAPVRPDPGEDISGAATVAVAVNKADPVPSVSPGAFPAPTPTPAAGQRPPSGRLVVVGNSEFATNTYFSQVIGNRDFFVNSVNWLAEDEQLISVRATPPGAPPIVLSNQAQVLVFYTSVVFVPLAVLLLGGAIWWQRR